VVDHPPILLQRLQGEVQTYAVHDAKWLADVKVSRKMKSRSGLVNEAFTACS
jgi:hypothetical protein